jgi:DNA polymerase-3 subunit chi
VAEVSFYHLLREPLERALPKLLEKALERDMRAVIRCTDPERLNTLNRQLWTYDQGSFLPHGSETDGHAELQPVYLTLKDENPNGANLLVLVDGAESPSIDQFERCLDLFDGNDDAAVAAARERWRKVKHAGVPATYWRQSETGKWEKQA